MMFHQSRHHLLKNLSRRITRRSSLIQTRSVSYRTRPVTVIHSEATNAVAQVMDAMDAPVYFETYDIKGNMNHLPLEIVGSIRKNKVCFNGRSNTSLSCVTRKKLNLFASVAQFYKNNFDIVVIRENTEGEFVKREHEVVPGVIQSFQVTMTKFWSERIAKYAFEYAQLNKRKKVTAVYNNNGKEMKLSDDFFLESCQEVAKMFPNITYDEIAIDNCCLQLVEEPERFDVIVTPNIYGNLVVNVAAGRFIMAGGGDFGSDYAIFGSSLGDDENPVALLLSSVMMLRHLQLPFFADRLQTAVNSVVISEAKCGNNSSIQEIVDTVIAKLG